MRRDRMTVPTFLMAVLLAVLVSFSCMMCLQDAFELACSPVVLLALCCGTSLAAAMAMWPRRSWPFVLAVALVYLLVLLWQRAALVQSVKYVLFQITSEYALCFDAMRVLGDDSGNALWCLAALAGPLSCLTAWVTSQEGNALLVLMACAPVLVICLIIVDLAPVLWLILLTGALMVLVISHSVRERSASEGSRLAWWLILPTVILVSGITVLWPPADYERMDWSDALQAMAEAKVDLEAWQEETFTSRPKWSRELRTVDLSRVGPKTMTGELVLSYRSDSALAYLRGVSLGVYADNTWKAVDAADYAAKNISDQPLTPIQQASSCLDVQTRSGEPLLYTTYHMAQLPQAGEAVDDAYAQNGQRVKEYTVDYAQDFNGLVGMSETYDRFVLETYLQIPAELQDALSAIAAQAGLNGASAQAVADYVRSSGVYDLNTPQVPAGEDFVLYFLQESHRGYCVHFASAATMLLRTVGIPARYVTGYSVSGGAGQWNEVTEDDAHAWVEYYVAGQGWLPLDPTPAVEEPNEPVTEPEQEEPPAEQELPQQLEQQTEQAEAVTQTAPGTTVVSDNTLPEKSCVELPRELLWLLTVPGLALLICLRRWFGLRYRRERCTKGHPNRRALTWWRWLVHLSKVGSRVIPEELLCLAEKARFSQHTMTEEELAKLQGAVEARIEELRQAPAGRRLWHQYGLVLY